MGIFTVVSNFCNLCLLGRQPTCHCGRVVPCVAASNMTGLYNAALNRPVFSSSVLLHWNNKYDFVPSLANDGSHETHAFRGGAARCFHSDREDNPWWAVDLGQAMSIYGVDFTNRADCCGMTKSIPAFSYRCLIRAVSTDWCFCTVWLNTKEDYWIFSLKLLCHSIITRSHGSARVL